MGIPAPPPFADPATTGARISGGVNYASAAAGILDETGQHYVNYSIFLHIYSYFRLLFLLLNII